MTREEFLRAAREEGLAASSYSIGVDGDEVYVARPDGAQWVVYYAERRHMNAPSYYESEEAALDGLFRLLMKDPTTRIR
jgi:hypothetical protein